MPSTDQWEKEDLEKTAPIRRLIREKKTGALNELTVVPARMIIEQLKNDLNDLDFFFSWFTDWCGGSLPGAGSYHYDGITNNRTFDVYNKYNFGPHNLFGDTITEEQWQYVLEIGYVTQEEYDQRTA